MLYLEHLAMSGIGTHNFVLLREILNTLSHYTNSIIKYRCFNHLHCFIFCLICYRSLDLPKEAIDLAGKRQFELKGSCFTAEKENLRQPKIVRVGAVQNQIVIPTTESVTKQVITIMHCLLAQFLRVQY